MAMEMNAKIKLLFVLKLIFYISLCLSIFVNVLRCYSLGICDKLLLCCTATLLVTISTHRNIIFGLIILSLINFINPHLALKPQFRSNDFTIYGTVLGWFVGAILKWSNMIKLLRKVEE